MSITFKWNGQDFTDSADSKIVDSKNRIVASDFSIKDGEYNISLDNFYEYHYYNNSYTLHIPYNSYKIKSNPVTIHIGNEWDIINLINEDHKIIFIDGNCTYQDGVLTSKYDVDIKFTQTDINNRPALKNEAIKYFSFNKTKYLELENPNILANKSSFSIFAIVRLKKYDNNIKANPIFNIDQTLDLAVSSKSVNKLTLQSYLNGAESSTNNSSTYIDEWMMIYAGVDYENNRSIIYTNGNLDNTFDNIFNTGDYSAENIISSFIGKDNNNNYFNGDLASLIIFPDQYFGHTNIARIFGWAAHNYNLTHKLIDSHDYKTEYPTLLNMYDIDIYYNDTIRGVVIKWYSDYTDEIISIYRDDDDLLYEGPINNQIYIDESIDLGEYISYTMYFQNSIVHRTTIFTGKIWTPMYYSGHALYLSGNNILLENNKISTAYDYINDFDFIQNNPIYMPKKEVLPLNYRGDGPGEHSESEFTNEYLNNITAITFNKDQILENYTYTNQINLLKPLHICLYMCHIYSNINPMPTPMSFEDEIDNGEIDYIDYIKNNAYLNIGQTIYFIDNECYIINQYNNEITSLSKHISLNYEVFDTILYTLDFSNNNIIVSFVYNDGIIEKYTTYLGNLNLLDYTIYLGKQKIRIGELLILNSNENIFKYVENLHYRLGYNVKPPVFNDIEYFNIRPNNNNLDECIITWISDYNIPTKFYSRGLNDTDLTYLGTATENSFITVVNAITIFDIEHNNVNYELVYYPPIKSNNKTVLNLNCLTGFRNNAPDINGGKIIQSGLMVNDEYPYYDEHYNDALGTIPNIYYLGNLYDSNFCLEIGTISNNITNTIIIRANNNNKITIKPTSVYTNNRYVESLSIKFGDDDELLYNIPLLYDTYHIMIVKIENGIEIYANGIYMGSATTENPIYFDETYIEHSIHYFKVFKFSQECPYDLTRKILPSYDVVDKFIYNIEYNKIDNNLDLVIDINLDSQYLYKVLYSEDNFVNSNVIISEGIYTDTLNINATITDDTLERIYIKTIVLDVYEQEINSNIKILMLKNVNFNIISVPFGPGGPPQ